MIPPFDFQEVVVAPWTELLPTYGWIALMGFLVMLACGLLGNFLILRRMALLGDAMSHSILPGIVIAFLIGKTRGPIAMFIGAVCAGLITAVLIEFIHRRTRVKQDAATGIVFSSFFAIGVLLISLFAGHVDLDADCVLYGELGNIGLEPKAVIFGVELAPIEVITMAFACLLVLALIVFFYKELLVTCFDPGLATSLGINPAIYHYALMGMLSVVVVSCFRAVGAILVVATLILPGATSYLVSNRLPRMLVLSAVHALLSAVIGMHLAIWLSCSFGAAMVVAGAMLFVLAWVIDLVRRGIHRTRALDLSAGTATPQ